MPCALLLAALAACRPDPGLPSYPDSGSLNAVDTSEPALPEGPDPYEEGEARLSVGLHYESGYSQLIPIDDVDSFYYIYESTYTEGIDQQDVVEGRQSTVINHGSLPWFGGGITWMTPRDLSAWTTMHLSLRSGDAGMATLNLHFTGGTEAVLSAADYGWVNDGQWHHLAVPLADFAAGGADLTAVTAPFVLIGEGGAEGETLKVDNLYYTQD